MTPQAMHNKRHAPRDRHRGITSVLAMLYLVLFSALAIGFYAANNTQTQVAANDEHVTRAFLATESGMDFMRHQLANVYIDENVQPGEVITYLYPELQRLLDNTPNLNNASPKSAESCIVSQPYPNVIRIPGDLNAQIPLDSQGLSKFRCSVYESGGNVKVIVQGAYGDTQGAGRSISLDFDRKPRQTSAWDYAVASRGQITVKQGKIVAKEGMSAADAAKITQMMSSLDQPGAITMSGGTVGGDLTVVDDPNLPPDQLAAITGGTVAGETNISTIYSDHLKAAAPPYWPEFDTSVYAPYAITTWSRGMPLSNVRIPAGANPKFTGNQDIQGIVYIESPNTVTFQGSVNLAGFIVFENTNDPTMNQLIFTGSIDAKPLPSGPQYDVFQTVGGVAVLAPTASVTISGSGNSTMPGSIICNTFDYSGAGNLEVDRGTIMALKEDAGAVTIEGNNGKAGSITFTGNGRDNAPRLGVKYANFFEPIPSSYEELRP